MMTAALLFSFAPAFAGAAFFPTGGQIGGAGLWAAVLCLAMLAALAAAARRAPRRAYAMAMGCDGDLAPSRDDDGHSPLHDTLTRLPGRQLAELALRRRRRQLTGVLAIGVDGLRLLNEVYGHALGDALLVAVAERLRSVARLGDTVARLQGDEFIVMVELRDPAQAVALAKCLLQRMQAPFQLNGNAFHASVSIGLHVRNPGRGCGREPIGAALIALRHAKENGRNCHCAYDASMGASAAEMMRMLDSLRRARKENEFFLLYQPKLDLETGRISGAEALLRWRHPQYGLLGPDRFVPVAEKTGMIGEVGAWVLDQACHQLRAWSGRNGGFDGTLAVNVSALELAMPGYEETVRAALARHGVAPARLLLEITESSAMRSPEATLLTLRRLRALGVGIALDDFGTGHSSLSHLKRMPVSELKVDRSFVRDLGRSDEDTALVEAILAMGKAVGVKVVAEGVETPDQQAVLAQMGCDSVQGYLIGQPLPAEEIARLAAERRAGGAL